MTNPRVPVPLTGLAIGDALGMPFETKTYASPELLEWDGTFQSGCTNELQPERKAGEWTDDTKMALALATSLIEASTYDPVKTLRHYKNWYDSGDHRGIGRTTRQALESINQGRHWDATGVLHAEGNGSAMRVAPIGAFFRNNLLTAASMARIDANLTHNSLEAQEGSAAVALAVALLCDDYPKEDILSPVITLLRHSKVQESLQKVKDFACHKPTPDEVFKALIDWGTGAHVVQTVPAAFLCFIGTTSFEEAVTLAVSAGGDTDTTAAITGALAGSFYGVSAIARYLSQLELAEHLLRVDELLFRTAPESQVDIYDKSLS